MKKNKKSLAICSIVFGCLFIFSACQSKSQITKFDSPAELIRVVLKLADNPENLWKLLGKMSQEKFSNVENFNRDTERWIQAHPEEVRAVRNARIKKVNMITPYRAWVECDSDIGQLNFYTVKEDGEWKNAQFHIYLARVVMLDMEFLRAVIKKYYTDKGHLPYTLAELIPDYADKLPMDHFSDKEKSYGYETLGEKQWKIYSIGPDSRDDLGLITAYDDTSDIDIKYRLPLFINFAKGDIVKVFNIE